MNLAARAGRWSANHRKTAIWGWLAFVVIAIVLGSAAGTKTISDSNNGNGESGRAEKAAARAFPENASETVIVQSRTLTASDPSFRTAVSDVKSRVSQTGVARHVKSGPGEISPDRHSALVQFDIPGNSDKSQQEVEKTLAAVAAAQTANPHLTIQEFGDASAGKALSKSFDSDFKKAETLSLPITLIILVLAFGAIVAAGIPLLLALSAVGATIGLVGLFSHVVPVDQSISSVILLIGLAVGVDYSLFYLRRESEERDAGARRARRSRPPPPRPAGRS